MSTDTETVTLRDVKRLTLKDGDTLVLLCNQRLSGDAAARLRHDMADRFPRHQILILDNSFDIAVIEEPAAA